VENINGNVLVIGLGLIGGSIALAIKHEYKGASVYGFDINEKNVQIAKLLGIIDEEVSMLESAASHADLIIIAVPVVETGKMLHSLADCSLKRNVIITDVGSTKTSITESAQTLLAQGYTFIGGHPMAGSHKSGAGAAKLHLFENAFYLLTPTEQIDKSQIELLQKWLKGTKANFLVTTPKNHDELAGVISHIPHIVAAGLVKQAESYSKENPLVSRLAAGGFRDITRIASSSPEMWRDILLHNKSVILSQLDGWNEGMEYIKGLIEKEDGEQILRFFQEAKEFRDELPAFGKGVIPAFYDLYVDIPDYPGVISEITGYLAKEEISLTNIRILETREELFGVLIISFQTEEDRMRAEACISKHTSFDTILS
jgi:prephenate dehydrogenase